MRYGIIILLSIIFLTLGCPDWLLYDNVPNLCKACSYQFFHANIFHLAVNCLSLYAIYRPTLLLNNRYLIKESMWAYAISVVAWFTAFSPVVGISNYLFAVLGLRTPSFRSKWWMLPTTKTFIIVMFGLLLIPKISAFTHIVSFSLGIAVARLKEVYNGR